MTLRHVAWVGCVSLGLAGAAFAQSPPTGAGGDGTPLVELIETVSKKSGKSFIIDPRVSGSARLIGIDASKLTYADLLSVLQVHGFAAIESGNIVRIVPDEQSRTSPTPLIKGNDRRPDGEYVTRVIKVRSVPAGQLVPVMRALLPSNAHLAAVACTNELIVVDTFANVRRIEALVAEMDKGDPLALPGCAARPPAEVSPAAPATPAPPRSGG